MNPADDHRGQQDPRRSEIRDVVHVQIPTVGADPNVVRIAERGFQRWSVVQALLSRPALLDHAAFPQSRHSLVIVSDLRQHLFRVLTQHRSAVANSAGSL